MHLTERQIEDLLLGKLPAQQAMEMSDHLDTCEQCDAAATQLASLSETVVARMRSQEGTYVDEPACGEMLSNIKRLAAEATTSDGRGQETHTQTRAETPLPERIRDYQILEQLGEGGVGVVYKALHTRLNKVVALKVLSAHSRGKAGALERFARETRAVGSLDHPHIVRATDAGQHEGQQYLVMEYAEGIDLSRLAARVGPLRIADACEIIRQAAIGLDAAHHHGLVHRDVKPSNLMLAIDRQSSASETNDSSDAASPPVVKILDLGLALFENPAESADDSAEDPADELTGDGQVMGTLDYLAPEQWADSHEVDSRTDIYALGATLFKLLTGEAPFAPRAPASSLKRLAAMATEEAPSIAGRRDDLPAGLVRVVDQMLARDPEQRFSTAKEVIEALTPFSRDADLSRLFARAMVEEDAAPESAVKPYSRRAATPADKRGSRVRLWMILVVALLAPTLTVLFLIRVQGATIVVEVEDPQTQVLIDGGKVPFKGAAGARTAIVTPGRHSLEVRLGEKTLQTKQLTVRRGEKVVVQVTLEKGRLQIALNGKPVAIDRKPPTETAPESPDIDRQVALTALAAGNHVTVANKTHSALQVNTLAELPPGPLRVLSLICFTTKPSPLQWQRLQKLPRLHFLSLYKRTGVGEEDLPRIVQLKHLHTLQLGAYASVPIGDEALRSLATMRSLTSLIVRSSRMTEAGLMAIGKCRGMRQLSVYTQAPITARGMRSLAQLEQLETLRLHLPGLTDSGLLPLADCPRLDTLKLAMAQVTGAGLSRLRGSRTLRRLILFQSEFTADDLKRLAEIEQLERIDMHQMPRVANSDLLMLATHKKLRVITVNNCPKVTQQGLDQLQAAMPQCAIRQDF